MTLTYSVLAHDPVTNTRVGVIRTPQGDTYAARWNRHGQFLNPDNTPSRLGVWDIDPCSTTSTPSTPSAPAHPVPSILPSEAH